MNKWSSQKSSDPFEGRQCRKCRKCWKPETGNRSWKTENESRSRSRKPNNGTEREREQTYYAKAIVSGTSPYGSRPHPTGDWAPADSESTGRVFRVEKREEGGLYTDVEQTEVMWMEWTVWTNWNQGLSDKLGAHGKIAHTRRVDNQWVVRMNWSQGSSDGLEAREKGPGLRFGRGRGQTQTTGWIVQSRRADGSQEGTEEAGHP
ncbi:hypothetical protein B0H14DRAFT_2637403 [Mycena olivaceomarginata]|nr:hypothetical protein B0H14DRAFT_2637403 [Mycena olivaceomarginata]